MTDRMEKNRANIPQTMTREEYDALPDEEKDALDIVHYFEPRAVRVDRPTVIGGPRIVRTTEPEVILDELGGES